MKRTIIILILLSILFTTSCFNGEQQERSPRLTMEELKQIAEKGENITWSDFDGYFHYRYGSGMISQTYPIEGDEYTLTITGQPPEHIQSVVLATSATCDPTDIKAIDIRTDSIENFLKSAKHSEFSYSGGKTATLALHSDEKLKDRYAHWEVGSSREYSTGDAKIAALIALLDRQEWLSLSPSVKLNHTMDASISLTRTLVSKTDNSTPCDVGDSAVLSYDFDFESGTVRMTYVVFSTDMWDRYCSLSPADLETAIETYYYYFSLHIE